MLVLNKWEILEGCQPTRVPSLTVCDDRPAPLPIGLTPVPTAGETGMTSRPPGDVTPRPSSPHLGPYLMIGL